MFMKKSIILNFRRPTDFYDICINNERSYKVQKNRFESFLTSLNKPNITFIELDTDEAKVVVNKGKIMDIYYLPSYGTININAKNEGEAEEIISNHKNRGYELNSVICDDDKVLQRLTDKYRL